jgi:hypothetical protein
MAKDDLVERVTGEAAQAEPEVESEERAAEIAASTVFEPDSPAAPAEPEVVADPEPGSAAQPAAEPEVVPDVDTPVGAPEVNA